MRNRVTISIGEQVHVCTVALPGEAVVTVPLVVSDPEARVNVKVEQVTDYHLLTDVQVRAVCQSLVERTQERDELREELEVIEGKEEAVRLAQILAGYVVGIEDNRDRRMPSGRTWGRMVRTARRILEVGP